MNAPLPFQQTTFIKSAEKLSQLPPDEGVEVAFVGRSNSGKSSALNTLTQQTKLARISKTPGRTQLMNIFEVTPDVRLVDLPGFGYAKVPDAMKQRWHETLNAYLSERNCLRGLVVIMDCRHPLKPQDTLVINWAVESGLAVHGLLTKADKLGRGAQQKTLQDTRKALAPLGERVTLQLFSALKKTGVEALQAQISSWCKGE